MAKPKTPKNGSHEGHGKGSHPLAGGMKPAPMPAPGTSSAPKSGITEAAKSDQKRGIHVPGVGGSKKSF